MFNVFFSYIFVPYCSSWYLSGKEDLCYKSERNKSDCQQNMRGVLQRVTEERKREMKLKMCRIQ